MKLFSSYNAFLALLDDAKKRERLKKLSLEEIPTDAVFGEVRSISRVFQEGLTAEAEIVALLSAVAFRGWRVVLHPDAIRDVGLPWNSFGPLSLIESMDKRNNCGRTAQETFGNSCQAAESGAVLDIGHCLQVDPTMNEAYLILRAFGDHVRQLHVSEVNSRSTHDPLSSAAIDAIP